MLLLHWENSKHISIALVQKTLRDVVELMSFLPIMNTEMFNTQFVVRDDILFQLTGTERIVSISIL